MQIVIPTAPEVHFSQKDKVRKITAKTIVKHAESSKLIPTNGKKRSKKRGPMKGAIYVPEPQQIRIKARHIRGESLSRIAREEGRDIKTVAKLIKAPDVQQHIEVLKERFYGSLETMLEVAIVHAKTAKDGGWLALEFLKSAGIVSDIRHANFNMSQQQPEKETEDEAVRRIAVALVQGAIERHKSFGLPLPEADEVETELKQEKAKEKHRV